MSNKALSDTQVRNLKPKAKPYKVSDGAGLFIQIEPRGAKLWRLAYRFAEKQKTLALGVFPASLADARADREAAKRELAAGKDPALSRRERKRSVVVDADQTFEKVAKRWYDARKTRWSEGHAARVWGSIKNDVIPVIGTYAVSAVSSDDVLRALQRFEARESFEMAHRTRTYIEGIFRYAKAKKLTKDNPPVDLNHALTTPPKKVNFKKLKAAELPDFFLRLNVYDGEETTRLALRLLILTMTRTIEIRFAIWDEFEELNGEQPLWRLSKMKRGVEHLVPLPRQTIPILERIKQTSNGSPYLFPAPTRTGVMSENTMLYALYRMGYHNRATVHGFRGTASTILNETNQFHKDWIERQHAHVEEDEIRGSYNSPNGCPVAGRCCIGGRTFDETEQSADVVG